MKKKKIEEEYKFFTKILKPGVPFIVKHKYEGVDYYYNIFTGTTTNEKIDPCNYFKSYKEIKNFRHTMYELLNKI